jgi:tRNA(fMet)-specific endonuclease VapC
MTYLFEEDATIDHFQGERGLQTLFPALARAGISLAETTLVELYTGMYLSDDPTARGAQLNAFLRGATILPLTRAVTLRAARIRADLVRQKLSIRTRAYDILAAAFALEHGLIIVTSNSSDYRNIVGLTQLDCRTGAITAH